MPNFATDLGHADPGVTYSMLLGADAAGALLAGVLLESGRKMFETKIASALVLACCWCSGSVSAGGAEGPRLALPS